MYPSSGGGERSPAYAYGSGNDTRISDGTSSRRWLYVVAGFGILGAFFSGLSTSDFIAHLDRQVHSIHCSIVPGAAAQFGESGCRTVMMSPYSSLFRESLWGGLPISLLAMAVFFYMAARALSFGLKGELSRRETGYMLLATMLPFLMSIIYGYLSMRELGAVCKLCVGVYVSSGGLVIAALLAHLAAPTHQGASPLAAWAVWFLIGVGYVGVLAGLYVGLVPEPKASREGCGTLLTREDPAEILLDIGGRRGGVNALAVLDPLCPACKGFDARLEASGLTQELALEAVLFPLDAGCNWMVKDSLHPGACAVSEAMLCLPKEAPTILESAFREQEEWLALAREDEAKLRRLLEERFPKVKGCLGSAKAKNRVNKSLRFAVANALPVLTPQLFIGDKRLCEEDTDLGLEYTVRRMINEVRP
ncbi:MAG: vitamin K epoxide reductase family protein [Myxococcota bacterium]